MLIIGNPLKKFLVHPSFVHEELGLGEAGGLLKVTHALVGRCELEPSTDHRGGAPPLHPDTTQPVLLHQVILATQEGNS